jgi:hypothetical protein
VLATGSALTFDGSKLLVSGSAASAYTNPFELKNTDGTGYLVSYMTVGSAQAAIRYAPTLFFKIGPDSGDTTTPLVFAVNNSTEVGRFTPAGNFGIGTSSPSARLHISGTTDATQRIIVNGTGNVSSYKLNYNGSEVAFIQNYQNSEFAIGTAVSAWMGFNTNNTERARIDSSGNFLVGTTSTTNGSLINWYKASGTIETSLGGTTAAQNHIVFANPNGNVGSIQVSASATAYNTSSDYRLKNITGPITTSGAYIDSLNPVEGTWKADGSTFVGLIAHEVQEASRTPVATGTKDGEQMQGMDYSSAEIIANLISEIQSLRKRLTALEGKA